MGQNEGHLLPGPQMDHVTVAVGVAERPKRHRIEILDLRDTTITFRREDRVLVAHDLRRQAAVAKTVRQKFQ